MYLVDTNIHIANLLLDYQNDLVTRQYQKFYLSLLPSEIAFSDVILSEFEAILNQVIPRRYTITGSDLQIFRNGVDEYLNTLYSQCHYFVGSASVLEEALNLFKDIRNKKYISFADCHIICMAQTEKVGLLSRDIRLVEIARERGVDCFLPSIAS